MKFDRIVCINLLRRPDRWREFNDEIKKTDFENIKRFNAYDHNKLGCPEWFTEGGPAACCARSHCTVLAEALNDDVQNILVFEDDACFRSNFRVKYAEFLENLPEDADGVRFDGVCLGGQHISAPVRINKHVVRCTNTQRTHSYSANRAYMKALLDLWQRVDSHCDWHVGEVQKKFKIYAPDPFLCGQSHSLSNINYRTNPKKFFCPPNGDETILVLKCSQEEINELRESYNVHLGYTLNSQGIDAGLVDSFNDKIKLTKWIGDLMWEVASEEEWTLGLYHPELETQLVKECWTGPVLEITSLPQAVDALLRIHDYSLKPKHFVIMVEDKKVFDAVKDKVHIGNWIDPITGLDNGLRLYTMGDANWRLSNIIHTLEYEAVAKKQKACLYHPQLVFDEVRNSTDYDVKLCHTVEEVEDLLKPPVAS